MKDDWNANYEAGDLPWDEPVPEPFLVEAVEAGALPRGRTRRRSWTGCAALGKKSRIMINLDTSFQPAHCAPSTGGTAGCPVAGAQGGHAR